MLELNGDGVGDNGDSDSVDYHSGDSDIGDAW